ncbi:dicarboxylate/amino acid:cation symporter [Sphingomonas qomolangmaensis]|uniref:Dicarboxylate/amino acid:cation symporter n=1 Tax=Sphingomonas qomolangmaensis TaxID=2918765 RepID=A0ABY5L8F3_9SPHN|nr:cation:dicarboxylase symporter family transporter [Sphingomonas qomolangmaensis]UUL82431.1 dicarboxylate/amino acid:cation symporter [Sphingomonas qomolangmaensis]
MSQAMRILMALAAGLAMGVALSQWQPGWAETGSAVAQPIGTIWLNALRMTIVPLVVALLVTGVAATAKAAKASRLAARAIVIFMSWLWISATLGALFALGLLDLFPLPADAGAALRASFSGAAPVGDVPPFSDFLVAMVPTNPISAAAEDQFLPLIIFTLTFAFALTTLPAEPRETLTRFFQAVADTMLVMIGWVLLLAPIGVFALAFVVGATAGTAAFGALVHYVAIVAGTGVLIWMLAYPTAMLLGRVPLKRFVRAVAPAQAVAISTQSSLASLPAMLRGTEALGLPVATAGVVLPLAVAIFRFTGPAMNIAVAVYVAHVFGIELAPQQVAIGVAAAAITALGSVSLPGTISFVSSIAPIALAMGVPIEPLALLVAVETMPDIVRTLGNVTMDVAVTSVVARGQDGVERSEADVLLEG